MAFFVPPPPSAVVPLDPPLDEPPPDEPPLDDAVPELLAVPLLPPPELDDEVESSSLQAPMAMMTPARNVTEPLRVNFIARQISERAGARTLQRLHHRALFAFVTGTGSCRSS